MRVEKSFNQRWQIKVIIATGAAFKGRQNYKAAHGMIYWTLHLPGASAAILEQSKRVTGTILISALTDSQTL